MSNPGLHSSFCSEIDINPKLVDMNALNYYMARRLLLIHKMEVGAPIPVADGANFSPPISTFDKILGFLGDDGSEIDPTQIDQQLHGGTKMLLDDEKVLMAFKAGRDMTVFTNLRILLIDVQGKNSVMLPVYAIGIVAQLVCCIS